MKRFITEDNVLEAAREGKESIFVSENDIITALAKETAVRRNISFVSTEASAGGKPQSANRTNAESAANNNTQKVRLHTVQAPKAPVLSIGAVKKLPYKGLLSDKEIAVWREEFPILKDVIHVGNCSQSAQSKRVRAAINRYLDNWLDVGMDWESWVGEVNLAKAEFAKLINASPDEIAVSASVSDLVSSVATALDFSGERSKVLVSDAEFPTVNYVWLAQQRRGAKVDFVPVNDNYQIDFNEYLRAIDSNTLITSYTHSFYLNGFKQDIAKIAELAHSRGSLVMVDSYQCLGTEPVDVKKMGIDILTSGVLKYLFGIPGIAFMYVNKELTQELSPSVTGWFGQKNPFLFQSRYIDWASNARRFDTGTPPVLTAYAAKAGLEITNEVGVERIKDRTDMLSAYALEYGSKHGLKIISPFDISIKAPTTAVWTSHKMPSYEVEAKMRERNIIVSARGDVVRVAPHFYNTVEEIDTVMTELASVLG